MASEPTKVIAGIDTHADTHHVAVINEHGKPLADKEFLAVGSGYRKIFDFITSYGTVAAVGVEGTGSYGAELVRTLRGEGLTVLEVNRPNRAARRPRCRAVISAAVAIARYFARILSGAETRSALIWLMAAVRALIAEARPERTIRRHSTGPSLAFGIAFVRPSSTDLAA